MFSVLDLYCKNFPRKLNMKENVSKLFQIILKSSLFGNFNCRWKWGFAFRAFGFALLGGHFCLGHFSLKIIYHSHNNRVARPSQIKSKNSTNCDKGRIKIKNICFNFFIDIKTRVKCPYDVVTITVDFQFFAQCLLWQKIQNTSIFWQIANMFANRVLVIFLCQIIDQSLYA